MLSHFVTGLHSTVHNSRFAGRGWTLAATSTRRLAIRKGQRTNIGYGCWLWKKVAVKMSPITFAKVSFLAEIDIGDNICDRVSLTSLIATHYNGCFIISS